jgi:hypothetical protein
MAACRACGEAIRFESTANGKLQPISIKTGVSHFADCPQAERFKKRAIPENLCGACGSDHVEREPGTGQHFAGLRCLDCGSHRWLRRPQESKA